MSREPDPERQGRHVYELTQTGRDLWPVIHSLLVWGDRHRARNSRTFMHSVCGTTLDERADCPKCAVTPDPQDVVVSPPVRGKGREDPVAVVLREPHRLLDPITT
jgi:hypothetical protein